MKNLTNSELKAKAREYRKGMLEGGDGFNPYENELETRLMDDFEALKLAEAQEWTLEVTKQRRVEFNAAKPTRATIDGIESRLGYTFADLKSAVIRHKIL